MRDMPFRQIHLDFHTSESIDYIGKEFSKEKFQECLKIGHVNSINIFAKCHHGWAYFPSEANEIHPNLDYDLLGEMLEACNEIGVRHQIYLSAGLDEKIAKRHKDWVFRNKNKSTTWVPSFDEPGYHRLCLNTKYLDYLIEQVKEVALKYKTEGIWLDIVGEYACYCDKCKKDMLEEGLDIEDDYAVKEFGKKTYKKYYTRINEAIKSVDPQLKIFHNSGDIRRGRRDLADANTHLEIEALPTGGWGYNHFPLSARYVNNLGKDYLGMTGKFHRSWGEFGGFKHPNALKYESGLILALGAKMCVGDQMHPDGLLDEVTYKLIGEAYKEVEEKEEWCDGVENVADIAILSAQSITSYLPKAFDYADGSLAGTINAQMAKEFSDNRLIKDSIYNILKTSFDLDKRVDSGVLNMLHEGNYLFNIIDVDHDFTPYKVLILPDMVVLNDELACKLNNYLKQGGKILATGESGLKQDKSEFLIDFGVTHLGKNPLNPDYFRPSFTYKGLGQTAFIMYGQGENIELKDSDEVMVLGQREDSYFNRTVEHFCSHQHAPNNKDRQSPGMVENKNGIYISWEVFNGYATDGSLIVKEMVYYALDRLLFNKKTLVTNLKQQGIVTLQKQIHKKRYINHLLYAVPVKKGTVEVVEDLVTVYDTEVQVNVQEKVKRVYLAPSKLDIPFMQVGDSVTYKVESFSCHQMVVIEY